MVLFSGVYLAYEGILHRGLLRQRYPTRKEIISKFLPQGAGRVHSGSLPGALAPISLCLPSYMRVWNAVKNNGLPLFFV